MRDIRGIRGGGTITTLDLIGPVDKILSEFISRCWLRFGYGGAEAAATWPTIARVDAVHMTGSAATYDAIVWGTGGQAAARKANNTPILDKPILAAPTGDMWRRG